MKSGLFSAAALLFTCLPASGTYRFSGTVTDASGSAVPNAEVRIRYAGGTELFTTGTDADGRFDWPNAPHGYFELRVAAEGFTSREIGVSVQRDSHDTRITLEPASVYTRVTVNATRGAPEETVSSAYVAIIKDNSDIRKRPIATIGGVLEHEPGVLVQQSTYAQVSPFLRGLSGYHVLNLVDGIRFNNSTFRSGPNQYLAFVDSMQAQRVEALLGPTGVQYGSDSLGGTINVVTTQPRFADRMWETHGDFTLGGATADLSGIGAGQLSVSNERVFWLAGASGRRHNDLRAGSGHDSRNVYHRLFGMSLDSVRDLVGSRQQDSGFRQYGVETRLALKLQPYQILTINYQRGVQDMVRGYKDLLGGLGRLQSTFDPQTLDFFYIRHEKLGIGPFDSVSGTFSLNSQTDGSRRQNLKLTDPVTADLAAVKVYGYTAQATTHWTSRLLASFGGDIYDEHISAERTVLNPQTRTIDRPRPLYPDRSRYQNLGIFGHGSYDLASTLRVTAGARVTGVRFATRQDETFGIPESSQWFRDVTYHTSLRWQIANAFGIHGIVSRGFRAPNLNDLGALGLNDLGYEIPAADAIPAGALLSTDSGEEALSKNARLAVLRPESLMNYEAGMRLTTRRLYTRVQFFDAELYDPIVRRTLLFPASSVPAELAGLPVTALAQTAAQQAQGVVGVATQLDPRAVKAFANDGRARFYGLETLVRYSITRPLSVEGNYSYIVGRELNPNRNMRRLPPQMGATTLRYAPSGRRPWVELAVAAAGAQDRLSGGDRDDERIGASFRRADIAAFFQGSRVASWLDSTGQVFQPTGEALLQIQNRVLPISSVINGVPISNDNSRVPLYLSTAGWATFSIRSGIPLSERIRAMAAVENLLDRNYRHHGSGVDAPGISAYVSFSYRY